MLMTKSFNCYLVNILHACSEKPCVIGSLNRRINPESITPSIAFVYMY